VQVPFACISEREEQYNAVLCEVSNSEYKKIFQSKIVRKTGFLMNAKILTSSESKSLSQR